MNAIPYNTPEENWDSYEGEEQLELPGRRRRQFFTRGSALLLALILGAVGFYVGVRVEKGQLPSSTTAGGAAAAAGTGAAARTGAAGRTGAARTGAGGATAGGATAGGGFARLFGGAGGAGGGSGNSSFGTVSSVSGNTLYVTDTSGNTIKVTLSSATKVTKDLGVSKNSVHPGDTVVVTGLKNSGGTLEATSVSDTGASASSNTSSSSSSSGTGGAGSAVSSLFGSGG